MAKNIDKKEEVVEEVETDTSKEKVVEKQPKVKETTKKEVKETVKEDKPVKEDKYKESKSKDPKKSYDIVESILANSTISNEGKIEKISKEAHVSYKAIIESFKELDTAVKDGVYASKPGEHARLIGNVYKSIRSAVNNNDEYVGLLQLKMILLLFTVYKNTVSVFGSFCVYCPEFDGTEEDYEDYQYCLATFKEIIRSINENELDKLPKKINFRLKEFKSGIKIEELYKTLI